MSQSAHLSWNGSAATAAIRQAAARGARLGAEHVLQVSRQKVPIEEGTLERSGTVSVDEQQATAAVSYDTPYARRVHEDLTARHAPGRSAKYLESVLPETAGEVQALIAAQVKRTLR
ncbi:minor capsid protein [Streptomyces orinoci]|uniref:Minor capsid protein n=1 Tax=Streptomyces orinoci TaxID=67339 RepID=A0ABV3K1L5_STRON|nr:minor capsid protein [Streptomyces orinoci]